jgi:broad specificity phosphatase PhoE
LPGTPETWAQFGARTRAALGAACSGAARDDAVLVVSSGGAISRAVVDIIGSPGATAVEFNLQFRNTGVCELIIGSDTTRLVTFNTLPHLDRADRRSAITFA